MNSNAICVLAVETFHRRQNKFGSLSSVKSKLLAIAMQCVVGMWLKLGKGDIGGF